LNLMRMEARDRLAEQETIRERIRARKSSLEMARRMAELATNGLNNLQAVTNAGELVRLAEAAFKIQTAVLGKVEEDKATSTTRTAEVRENTRRLTSQWCEERYGNSAKGSLPRRWCKQLLPVGHDDSPETSLVSHRSCIATQVLGDVVNCVRGDLQRGGAGVSSSPVHYCFLLRPRIRAAFA
jgi:hypothetical protein